MWSVCIFAPRDGSIPTVTWRPGLEQEGTQASDQNNVMNKNLWPSSI